MKLGMLNIDCCRNAYLYRSTQSALQPEPGRSTYLRVMEEPMDYLNDESSLLLIYLIEYTFGDRDSAWGPWLQVLR